MVLAIALGTYTWFQVTHVKITVENDVYPGVDVTNIQLNVRGDRATIDRLAYRERRTVRLKPNGQSLTGHFTVGREECQLDGVYVDPMLPGSVTMELHSCLDVHLER